MSEFQQMGRKERRTLRRALVEKVAENYPEGTAVSQAGVARVIALSSTTKTWHQKLYGSTTPNKSSNKTAGRFVADVHRITGGEKERVRQPRGSRNG